MTIILSYFQKSAIFQNYVLTYSRKGGGRRNRIFRLTNPKNRSVVNASHSKWSVAILGTDIFNTINRRLMLITIKDTEIYT